MKNRTALIGLIALCGLATTALAQPTLRLVRVRTVDTFPVNQSRYSSAANLVSGVNFFIGNNPVSVAYDGESLYVGGMLGGTFSLTVAGSPNPRAMLSDGFNTPSDFGGVVINPTNGQLVVAGAALTEIATGDAIPIGSGKYWATAAVKIRLNANGTNDFIINRYMRSGFQDDAFVANSFDLDGILNTGVVDAFRASSMDFSPTAGLLLAFDNNANAAGKVRIYNTTTQLNPILITPSPDNQTLQNKRLIGGVSWDFGPTGAGLDYKLADGTLGNDGVLDGPVVASLQLPSNPNANQWGPIGLNPTTLAFNYSTATPDFTNGIAYSAGLPFPPSGPIAPHNNGPTINGAADNNLYRDIAIHPLTGTIIARASNDLIYAYRNANGTTTISPAGLRPDLTAINTNRITSPTGFPFQVGQKCGIIYNIPGTPDLAVWNDVGSAATTIESVLRFNKLDGVVPPAPATVEFLDQLPDNSRVPLVLNLGGRIADMYYHEPSKTLAVVSFSSRLVHLFQVEAIPTIPTCLADLVGGDGNPPADGSVDGNDFSAFLNAFGAGGALADIVGGEGNPPADGSVDGNDFSAFLNAFGAGC